jgi:hypothetical protein
MGEKSYANVAFIGDDEIELVDQDTGLTVTMRRIQEE